MFPLSLFFSLCSPLFLPPHLSTFSSIVLFNFLLCCPFACSQGLSTPHLTKPSSVFLLMELRQWWNQPPRKMQKGWGGRKQPKQQQKADHTMSWLKKKTLSGRYKDTLFLCVCGYVCVRVRLWGCTLHFVLSWQIRLQDGEFKLWIQHVWLCEWERARRQDLRLSDNIGGLRKL